MEIVHALLALIAACVVFALVARHARLPYAVILVLGGMALAFIPGLPHVTLDPEIALAFFLPPLLQASAWRTDWPAFRSNLRPIMLLAVGAVIFTTIVVAVVIKALVPGLPWAAAIALGAIVAPPDAVAAEAVLSRVRLPRRIVTVLQGESLINDASALVIYRTAVATVTVGILEWAPGEFVWVAAGGLALGWALALMAEFVMRRLRDTLLEIITSFLFCFAAFLVGEAIHVSGVIAVVTLGVILGRRQHTLLSSRTRMDARAVWNFVEFVLNSLIFILIGLQLRGILIRLDAWHWTELLAIALAVSVTLIVARFVWVFPATWVPRLIPAIARRDPTPPWQHSVIISWAGMRGVVSLAAALALPLAFPERDLIVFVAFCAILATLVLQGTTLEWLIRRLGVEEGGRAGPNLAEAEARRLVAKATLAALHQRAQDPLDGAIASDLLPEYRDKARVLEGIGTGATEAELAARLQLRLMALRAGREELLRHHRETALHAELMAGLEEELDFEELRLQSLLGVRGHG
jgi:CPA1 family monovalent cation:H+ antiporter